MMLMPGSPAAPAPRNDDIVVKPSHYRTAPRCRSADCSHIRAWASDVVSTSCGVRKNHGRAWPGHLRSASETPIPGTVLGSSPGTGMAGIWRSGRVQQVEILLVHGHVLAERDCRR